MKYLTPKYEAFVMETEDILTVSSNQTAYYEVELKADGSGKIIITASDLFSLFR
jgi:hypothetical protein